MEYNYFFWAMVGVVSLALIGGALCGTFHSMARTLFGVLALALGIGLSVYLLAGGRVATQGLPIFSAILMLSIAAFMFGLVIATAVALLTRRIVQQRVSRGPD